MMVALDVAARVFFLFLGLGYSGIARRRRSFGLGHYGACETKESGSVGRCLRSLERVCNCRGNDDAAMLLAAWVSAASTHFALAPSTAVHGCIITCRTWVVDFVLQTV